MRYIFLFLGFLLISLSGISQVDKIKESPIYVTDDLVIVGITAKTTDKELLELRTKLLKYSSIRFTNFDVIRVNKESKWFKSLFKKEFGDIQFISMEVDCRDGFSGKISHSFESGDTSVQGFYRDYKKNSYKKSFFIGDLTKETMRINEENKAEKEILENK